MESMKDITIKTLKARENWLADGMPEAEVKRMYDQTVDEASAGVVPVGDMDCPVEMIGCWFDCVRGIYIGQSVIDFAAQFKEFTPDEDSRRVYDDDYTEEFIRAEDFMNQKIKHPEGTTFGLNYNGDWGLWRDDETEVS